MEKLSSSITSVPMRVTLETKRKGCVTESTTVQTTADTISMMDTHELDNQTFPGITDDLTYTADTVLNRKNELSEEECEADCNKAVGV